MSREPDIDIPPGEYLLALVWFARKESQKGNHYLRCRFVVCSGPKEGAGFFTPWSLDTSKPGSQRRWEVWMEQVGCDKELDLDDDKAIARAFKGKAFVAEVQTQQRGEYRNTDIGRLVYKRNYSERQRQAIEDWNTKWNTRGWESQDPGADPQASGEQAPPPHSDPQWSSGSSFGGDDDDGIPF